jgi:hypothetical protein
MTKGDFFRALDQLQIEVDNYVQESNFFGKFTLDREGKLGQPTMQIVAASAAFFQLSFNYEIYYEATPYNLNPTFAEACGRIAEYMVEKEPDSVFAYYQTYDVQSTQRVLAERVLTKISN